MDIHPAETTAMKAMGFEKVQRFVVRDYVGSGKCSK